MPNRILYTTDTDLALLKIPSVPSKVVTELDATNKTMLFAAIKTMHPGDILVVNSFADLATRLEDRKVVFDAVNRRGGKLKSLRSGQEFKDFSEYLEAIEELGGRVVPKKAVPKKKAKLDDVEQYRIFNEVINLHVDGYSCREISKKLGGTPSHATINRMIQKYEKGMRGQESQVQQRRRTA